MNRFLENESLELNKRVNLESQPSDVKDYKDWLLKTSESEPQPLRTENRSNSFELLDVDLELDLIDDLDELNLNDEQRTPTLESELDDGVTRKFMQIANMPTDYWLLKPSVDV